MTTSESAIPHSTPRRGERDRSGDSPTPFRVALVLSLLLHALIFLPGFGLVLEGDSADRADEDPQRETPPEERPPQPDQPRELRLGIAESAKTTLNWIGYEEYEEHLARQAEIEQAALRLAVAGAPGEPSESSEEAPMPAPTAVALAPQPPAELEGTPTPPTAPEPPTPTPQPTPETTPQATQPAKPVEAPPVPPDETPQQPPPQPEPQPEPVPQPEPLPEPEPEPEPKPEPEPETKPDDPSETPPAEDPEVGPPAPPTPETPPAPPTPPATPGGGGGGGGGDAADDPVGSGERSEAEADPTSIRNVPSAQWRNGRPIAAEGMTIQTRKPRFTVLTMVTARPTNPIVEIRFDHEGRPRGTRYLRSSGHDNIDGPIMDAIAGWRARGKALDALRPGDTVTVRLRLMLVE